MISYNSTTTVTATATTAATATTMATANTATTTTATTIYWHRTKVYMLTCLQCQQQHRQLQSHLMGDW